MNQRARKQCVCGLAKCIRFINYSSSSRYAEDRCLKFLAETKVYDMNKVIEIQAEFIVVKKVSKNGSTEWSELLAMSRLARPAVGTVEDIIRFVTGYEQSVETVRFQSDRGVVEQSGRQR